MISRPPIVFGVYHVERFDSDIAQAYYASCGSLIDGDYERQSFLLMRVKTAPKMRHFLQCGLAVVRLSQRLLKLAKDS